MRRTLILIGLTLYYLLIIFFFAGFLFPLPNFKFALIHRAILTLAALGFVLLPLIAYLYKKALGWKGFLYSVIPLLTLAGGLYLFMMVRFYYLRRIPFEPFLQLPSPTWVGDEKPKPDSTFRVLFLGGSTTRNGHLPEAQRYPEVCGKILHDLFPGRKIEILNAGQNLYTSKHTLIDYVTNTYAWKPDLVVALHGINELMRSFSPLHFALGRYNDAWTHFYGPAIRGANPDTYEEHLITHYFNVLGYGWYGRQRYQERDVPLAQFPSLGMYEKYLRNEVRALKSSGVKIMILNQPSLYQDNIPPREQKKIYFGIEYCNRQEGWFKYTYPSTGSMRRALRAFNQVTQEVASQEGVVFLDADACVPKDVEHFVDDVHFSPAGSETLARVVAEAIGKCGVVDSVKDTWEK
jgi:lysophospholipase L1-like esterase